MNSCKSTYRLSLLVVLCQLIMLPINAQTKKAVSLEDVWTKNSFSQRTVSDVNWMKNGAYYTSLVDGAIIQYNVITGDAVSTLVNKADLKRVYGSEVKIDEYQFSPDETKLLIASQHEPIYRRSSKSFYFIYDLKSTGKPTLIPLSTGGKQSYATFSPDGSKIAFARENNLFFVDLKTMAETQITKDGLFNHIIHGSADWVYEEEFSFAKGFDWSSDSRKIAYYTFDESNVKEYNMQVFKGLYPTDYRFKYPKAGEANSSITISVYDLLSSQSVKMDIGPEKDIYIPRINWTKDPNLLSIRKMNRLQNKLELLHANATTGQSKVILSEQNDTYVDLEFTDHLTYLKNGKQFVYASEKSGFKHLYLYEMSGNLVQQITKGDWEVSDLAGIDEQNKLLYYTSTEESPLERQLYSIQLDGKGKKKLSDKRGTNRADFSPDFKFYLNYVSSVSSPLTVSLHQTPSGKLVKALENNEALNTRLKELNLSKKEFFQFRTDNNTSLNGWMIKPSNFDATKKYPVLMFVYGGPGSQTVTDSWDSRDFFWYQILADKGYIIASVDNRGTGARGANFRKATYVQLGKLEVQDQIAGAKYLSGLEYIDRNRIGIWGWSYGGYMTSLCLTVGADVFKAGIAVAPVTNWRFYDTIYTERYLKTPQENPSGYDDNSPVNHVSKLKGKFLLIHGTGDDNVHFQNSIALQDALIRANKQFESFYYPNRNHGIYGGNTRLHLYTMMTKFLEENL